MQRSLHHGRRSLEDVIAIGMGFQEADAMQKGGEVRREAKGGSHALESTDAWENRQQLVAFCAAAGGVLNWREVRVEWKSACIRLSSECDRDPTPGALSLDLRWT
ncbi:hypothetical protein EAH_00068110 [Eimeria acervulina]|uniref:Uncharacterized protein n=1 Tax=Eimeria acervulina TaxID=5801 RepID=U6GTX7_EIMAC|nr:hypothetical protein EAH_00068110 [Eimeria acervulina]CDI83002.1 hypothetical protein EAH_00068110 [Eimeria acervulina]